MKCFNVGYVVYVIVLNKIEIITLKLGKVSERAFAQYVTTRFYCRSAVCTAENLWKRVFGSGIILPQFTQPLRFLSSFQSLQDFITSLQALEGNFIAGSIGMHFLCKFQIFGFQVTLLWHRSRSVSKKFPTSFSFTVTSQSRKSSHGSDSWHATWTAKRVPRRLANAPWISRGHRKISGIC